MFLGRISGLRSIQIASTYLTVSLVTLAGNSTFAQNGQFVDGIYRSMFDDQAERDRQAAAQRQANFGTRVEPVPRTTPFPTQPVGSAQPSFAPTGTPFGSSGTIARPANTSSANWFMDSILSIRDNIGRLIPELQRYSNSVSGARELIGSMYQIQSDTNSLYSRVNSGESFNSIYPTYQQVDVRWRDASYRLRASGSLDNRLVSLVSAIDGSFQTIDRQLGVTPPIDRVRLRDLMIVTLTYMDAMFDDVRLVPGAFGQADALIRDGRTLRERLRQESYKIDRADYDEVVTSYTEFVRQWRTYAARLYALNDAHVNQRLDSIRRQGDEVYASLRIQAASDRRALQFAGQRLTASLSALQSQLQSWGVNRLPADQARFADSVRTLVDRSQRLESELGRGASLTTASSMFTDMDQIWTNSLRSMRAVDPRSGLQTSLVQVDAIFGELRDLLQVGPWQGQSELLNVAASLEAAADDFNNDVQRYKRYLNPNQYRDSLSDVSDNIFDLSRDLHRVLDERGDLREASRVTQQLVSRWQQLTPMLNELTQRGLTQSRADQLGEGYRQLQSLVAKIASTTLN